MTGTQALPDGGGTRADYCAEGGPAALVSTVSSGTPVCAGQIAQSSFRFALCTCDDLISSAPISTDSFDGTQGPYSAATATIGGSIGSNGFLSVGGPSEIAGSVWAGDADAGLSSPSEVTIEGELHAAGLVNLTAAGVTVDTDAWAQSGLVVAGNALIAGTLYLPQGAPLDVGGTKTIGTIVNETVQVPAPCDCAAPLLVDVGGFVETYRAKNDDADVGLDPLMFENVQAPLSETIPCGRFFFTRIGAHAPVNLTVSGRAAIFIGGDFDADDDFFVDVPPGSELDLFIEGNVVASQGFRVGDEANPALARTYIGGNGDVSIQTATSITGNLYAPSAQLVLSDAGTTIFGGAFVQGLATGIGSLSVHFDESVVRQASTCPAPAACTTCRDCENQACRDGGCGACSDSSECCAPLVCRSGTCVLDIR
jgi:hypothetical protein